MKTNELTVKMIFDRWHSLIKNCDDFLAAVSDETLLKEIVPGKNRGVYLLGHLVAVHDAMLPLLDMGDKLYPELYEPFVTSPDKAAETIPSVQELRGMWTNINTVMNGKFQNLSADDWFGKHTAVSAEDFAREPHRNKLNIILTRTTHLSYHIGQLLLLK